MMYTKELDMTKPNKILPNMNEITPFDPSECEYIKEKANFLRNDLVACLNDPMTGGVSAENVQVIKFHGMYTQDDRDLRNERQAKKLEPKYSYLVRIRMAGGVVTPKQWNEMDSFSATSTIPTLKLTTRQAVQYHGILKRDLVECHRSLVSVGLDSIATAGDVNRNVMCVANPADSSVHQEVHKISADLSDYLLPKSTAYYEIMCDDKKITSKTSDDQEPIYGKYYLPRKFKINFTIPPQNDNDIWANDISFVAIEKNGKLEGFNVMIGGGLGHTHGDDSTFPRLATTIGYIDKDQVTEMAEAILTIQRDYGNRTNRKNARLKYTVDRLGVDFFKEEIAERVSFKVQDEQAFEITDNNDRYGWVKGANGKWNYTVFVEGGRVIDVDGYPMKKGFRAISEILKGHFVLTGNQNLIIADIVEADKKQIEDILVEYKIMEHQDISGLRGAAIACVALNTCPLAMAEAERYLPVLISKLEGIFAKHGLRDQPVNIRMTGCPNGCGRSILGEIGFVGKSMGKYQMYLGASHTGHRLAGLFADNVGEEQIIDLLTPIIEDYAKNRNKNERFGDFTVRKAYVREVFDGKTFNELV